MNNVLMHNILTSISIPLPNYRQKCTDIFTQAQINYVKCTSVGDAPTSYITKQFQKTLTTL